MQTITRPLFVAFDEQKAVRIYHRNLPHWRQEGATYFVTFRLADSIPEDVRREWEHEKRAWLAARGIRYDGESGAWVKAFERLPMDEKFQFQKHFNRQVQACLDCGLGECHLRRRECIAAVRERLFAEDGNRHHVGDVVIMPNHVHLLITPAVGVKLESVLKSLKGGSAVACNRELGRTGTLWQADSYDHIVRSLEQLVFYRQYIADNPKQAGIELPQTAIYRAEWIDAWLEK
jgi:type I restriction enzyme R subunit